MYKEDGGGRETTALLYREEECPTEGRKYTRTYTTYQRQAWVDDEVMK